MQDQIDRAGLGARIRRLRRDRGLSQAELAAPQYSAAYVSHLEKGKRNPSPRALEHVAERLGVKVEHLITGRDPDLDLRLRVEVDRAMASIHSGETEEARSELLRLLNKAKKLRLEEVCARSEEGLALIAQRAGRWDEVFERLDAAEAYVRDEVTERRTPIVTARARTYFLAGDTSRAIHELERHLLELNRDEAADPTALLQTYSALIGPYFEAGFRERAAEVAEAGHQLAAVVEDAEHVACLHINRAQILLDKGRRREALRSLTKADELFNQIGWRDSAIKASVALATAAVEVGNLDRAERVVTDTLQRLEEFPSVVDKARALNLLARIERLRGNPQQGLAHLHSVDHDLSGVPKLELAWTRREAGLCHLDLDEPKKAHEQFEAALKLYAETNSPIAVATTSALVGDALVRLGKTKQALSVYRDGLSAVEDLA